jgi:hypothetical protein
MNWFTLWFKEWLCWMSSWVLWKFYIYKMLWKTFTLWEIVMGRREWRLEWGWGGLVWKYVWRGEEVWFGRVWEGFTALLWRATGNGIVKPAGCLASHSPRPPPPTNQPVWIWYTTLQYVPVHSAPFPALAAWFVLPFSLHVSSTPNLVGSLSILLIPWS